MNINMIAAISINGVIGKSQSLPWKLKEDLLFFKEITLNKTIIMGRKNHESIGRALPGRINIVISRDPAYSSKDCLTVRSIDEALKHSCDQPFIIGGSEIYKLALPRCITFYRTTVLSYVEGDVYFPDYDKKEWQATKILSRDKSELNEYSFIIEKLQRNKQLNLF